MALQYENCNKGSQTAEAKLTSIFAKAKTANELRKKARSRGCEKRNNKEDQ